MAFNTNNNDYSAHTGLPITKQKSYEITVVPEGITTRTLFAPLGTKKTLSWIKARFS